MKKLNSYLRPRLVFRNGLMALVIIIAGIVCFSGCMKTTITVPVVNSSSSIEAIVNNATNLTVLDSILKRTGLISLLGSKDTVYTLFSPPNLAFSTIGLYDSTLYKDSTGYLLRLAKYHLIAGVAKTAALITADLMGPNAPYLSASGDTLYFTVNSTGIYINGNPLTQTDVMASNGVIHAIQSVLIPPTGTVWHTLAYDSALYNDSSLTYLAAALNRASTSTSAAVNLDSLLSGGVFSIFAPINAAFQADSNLSSIAAINAADPDSLYRLLTRHIVAGRVFSSDFSTTTKIPTLLQGDSVAFTVIYGTLGILQNDSINVSNFSTQNILATNGVIHKVGQLLVP